MAEVKLSDELVAQEPVVLTDDELLAVAGGSGRDDGLLSW
jgi:hypothetical protein